MIKEDLVEKNIFITGATGFIGEKLALRLAEKNQVFALVRPASIKKTQALKEKGIRIISGDLLNSNSYVEELHNIDYIFHLAALCKLDAPKKELHKQNVLGTKILLESCLNKNIRKIIHFSTAYFAGTNEKDSISEDEPYPNQFKNYYEWSKAEGEKIALAFYKRYSLPLVILRPTIVYGPGSTWGFYDALSLISEGKLWMLPGNGKNKIHLVHVDDVVSAAIYLAKIKNNLGEIYHICEDFPFSCSKLIEVICQRLGREVPSIALRRSIIKFSSRLPIWKLLFRGVPAQLLDYFLYNQTYSNSKIKSTGYAFNYPTPLEGLKSTVDWYLKHGFFGRN